MKLIWTNRHCLLIFFFVTLAFSSMSGAEELSHYNFDAGSFHTSDELKFQSYGLQYRSHRRDISYPFDGANETALDWGFYFVHQLGNLKTLDFSGNQLGGIVGKKYSKQLYVEALLVAHQFENSKSMSNSMLSPAIKVDYIHEKKWEFYGEVDKSYMYTQGLVPGPVQKAYTKWSLRPNGAYYFSENLKVAFRPELAWSNDGNRKMYLDASVMYALSLWPTWLWVGVGGEKLTNSKSSDYWSPSQFYSYGLRIEASRLLFGKISGSLAANLNKMKEEESKTGDGHYLNAGIMYGARNQNNIKIDFTNIKAIQSNNVWESSGLNLVFNYFY